MSVKLKGLFKLYMMIGRDVEVHEYGDSVNPGDITCAYLEDVYLSSDNKVQLVLDMGDHNLILGKWQKVEAKKEEVWATEVMT